jgi:enamine deaminase RidA (YjgF/YER057c/UK114 family)
LASSKHTPAAGTASASELKRQNIQPATLYERRVNGVLLYSPVVKVTHGSFIFVSGLLSRDVHGTVIGEGDMREQIRQVTRNLEWALASAGASLKDVVRTCTFTTDIDEFFRHPDLRDELFGPALPTSTTIGVSRLSDPRFLVEVEAFAMLG